MLPGHWTPVPELKTEKPTHEGTSAPLRVKSIPPSDPFSAAVVQIRGTHGVITENLVCTRPSLPEWLMEATLQ
jgi:hypothetical protein